MIGQRFGRLLVTDAAAPLYSKKSAAWTVTCDCGNVKVIAGYSLRDGTSRSCGCLRNEATGARRRTHGACTTATYRTWQGIKTRCTNPADKRYADYGGRGIKMSPDWRASFDAFLRDMGERPSPQHTIDRIDTNGNYEPGNCRWLAAALQARNKRTSRVIEHLGVRGCVAAVAEHFGVSARTVYCRLERGWSVDDAMTRPVHRTIPLTA